MRFELSEDQEALRAAATELLERQSSMRAVRAVVDAGGGWDHDLYAAMVEQGWTALVVPEAAGGVGLGWVEAAVLLEAVGAHLAPAPIAGALVAAEALAGTRWLEGVLDGSVVVAVSGDDHSPVAFAPSAGVVVRRVGDEVVAYEAECAAEAAMDLTRELGWAPVPTDGSASRLDVDPERFSDTGAVAMAAELLGICDRALHLTVEYAKERVQFDKPIGSFQAVKHRCADMLVDVEAMRSVVYWAAWCLAVDDPDRSVAASTAKSWCSDASRRVLASALQVHGGIGFTWEADIHLFLKRGQLDQLEFGTAAAHRDRLSALLRTRLEQGVSVI